MRDKETYYNAPLSESGPALRALVWVGRHLVGTSMRVIFRAKYENLEIFDQLPEGRPVIIAGNHSSYTDPLFVFDSIWPRRVRFMAKAVLFDHFALGRILAYFGVFPVHQDTRGRKAIKCAVACLKRGEYLGIFPEGTRVKERDKTNVSSSDGVALIAKMADAIIVPVGIEGTLDISPDYSKRLHFSKVTLRYGQPVDWRDFKEFGKSQMLTAVTKETMRRVYALALGEDPGFMLPSVSDVSKETENKAKKEVDFSENLLETQQHVADDAQSAQTAKE